MCVIIFDGDNTGSADVTSELNADIQSAINQNLMLFIPAGTYNVSAGRLTVDGPCDILGAGKSTVLQRRVDIDEPLFDVTGDNVVIMYMALEYTPSSYQATGWHKALIFRDCENSQAFDVHVIGRFYQGITFSNVTRAMCRYNSVKGCVNRAYYAAGDTVEAIFAGNTADGAEQGSDVPFTHYGFNTNPGGTKTPSKVIIRDCVAKDCQFQGIAVSERYSDIIVQGNTCERITSGHGILVQNANGHRGRNAIISSNITRGCLFGLLVLDSDFVIVDNLISHDNISSGIWIRNCTHVSVNGTMSQDNGTYGINIDATALGVCHDITLNSVHAVNNSSKGITTTDMVDKVICTGCIADIDVLASNSIVENNLQG